MEFLVGQLYYGLDLVLLVMEVLDLPDVVFLCVVEDLKQVFRLVLDCQVLTLLRLEDVLGEEHRLFSGFANIGLPISISIVK